MKISTYKPVLTVLLLFITVFTQAQNISIPDANFKQALLDHADINTNGDSEISQDEAENFTGTLNVKYKNISDLTGFEYFTNITEFHCGINPISTLDVSNNLKLTTLTCEHADLTHVILGNNTVLTTLYLHYNDFTSLDISSVTGITRFTCHNSRLTSLDVSQNTELTYFICSFNQLKTLDLSNNTELEELSCSNNLLTSLDLSSNSSLKKVYCSDNQLNSLELGANLLLTDLYGYNNTLNALDVSKNEALTTLICYGNQLSGLDVSANSVLTTLRCENNQLTNLNVGSGTALKSLTCHDNQLSSLNLNDNTALETLYCHNNQLNQINVNNNTALRSVVCYNNQLSQIDVSSNTALSGMVCNNNQLTSLDFSNNLNLQFLDCVANLLTELDMSNNALLQVMNCSDNQITNLILNNSNGVLSYINCNDNRLPFSELKQIKDNFPSLNYSSDKKIFSEVSGKYGLEVDYSTESTIDGNQTSFKWYSSGGDLLDESTVKEQETSGVFRFIQSVIANCKMTNDAFPGLELQTESITITETILDIPDANFKEALVSNNSINTNSDDEISLSEAVAYSGTIYIPSRNIADLTGIEYFTNLYALICPGNQISSLDVSQNTKLTSLRCHKNQLSTLNLSKNTALLELTCNDNQLAALDLNENSKLYVLHCGNNQLTDLDISVNTKLIFLYCENNQLTNLDVSQNPDLVELVCSDNQLNSLDLSYITSLDLMTCNNNKFPFSALQAIKDYFPGLDYSSDKKIFEPLEENTGFELDYTTETIINGITTSFNWFDDEGNTVSTSSIQEQSTSGIFQFLEPGTYHCKMTNTGFPGIELETESITIRKKEQNINLGDFPRSAYIKNVIRLSATSSSGLSVRFELQNNMGILKGSKLTCNKGGTIEIKAIQDGNNEYEATEESFRIRVYKYSQRVDFIDLPDTVYVNDVIELTTRSTSGGTIVYQVIDGEANLKTNVLTCTKAGSLEIKAYQPGTSYYYPASTSQIITVIKKEQHIEILNTPLEANAKDTIQIEALASSGLEVLFELLEGDATIKQDTIIFNASGTVKINAFQEGNDEYLACSDTLEIEVGFATGIDEFYSHSIQVYPNPVVKELNINFVTDADKLISLYDLTGKLIKRKETFSIKEQLNLSNVNQGVYILKIQSEGRIASYKIIKN